MSDFGFDVGNTEPQVGFDPLPPGWYNMIVTKADMVQSDNPAVGGDMLKIELTVDENAHPDYHNRKAWSNFCHHHEKKQTRDIARAQIAAICRAVGRPNAASATEMLGGRLQVKLTVKPAEGNYDARNDCKGFRAIGQFDDIAAPAGLAASLAPAANESGAAPAASFVPAFRRQPWKK